MATGPKYFKCLYLYSYLCCVFSLLFKMLNKFVKSNKFQCLVKMMSIRRIMLAVNGGYLKPSLISSNLELNNLIPVMMVGCAISSFAAETGFDVTGKTHEMMS